ncbi:peptide ABC transporter substrate-binding protein, partial [Clostridium sp. D2Q-11]
EEGLEEIGKTAEDMNGIKFLTFDGDNAVQRAQIWQQYWNETLGVDVEIEQATFKIKIDRENKGDFAFSYSGWIGDYNDPMTFMDMWVTGGSQNTAKWSNEKYDELIKTAQTTSGPERMEAMLEAERILMEEMPVSPTDHSVKIVMENPKVKGIVRLPLQMTDGLYKAYIVE